MRTPIRSILAALALLALPLPALAADPIHIGWKAELGDLQLRAPVPTGGLCAQNTILVPVTPSAVKAMKKLKLRLPPAFPGASAKYTCQGSVYGAPSFCMVFSLRKCVED